MCRRNVAVHWAICSGVILQGWGVSLQTRSSGLKGQKAWQIRNIRHLFGRRPELDGRATSGGKAGSERGFALLIVVIALVVLSLLLGSVITANRQAIDRTSARVAMVGLRAATEGAFLTEVYELSQPAGRPSFGTPKIVKIGEISVTTRTRPEAGKLDLNYASKDSLARLLKASGLKEDRSVKISNDIIGWRNGTKQGGSIDRLDSDASSNLPRHPFETLSDLAATGKDGADLVACLASDVTIYTHSPDVDVRSASDRLKTSLAAEPGKLQTAAPYMSVVGGSAGFPDLYELTATAKDDATGVVIRRQFIFRLTGDPKYPIGILADTSPAPDPASEAVACSRLAAHDK
jgi:general secretion pathway protein K